jgi:hypothetical protein
MKNLLDGMSVYEDLTTNMWVVAETGQASDNVRVGVGQSLVDAYQALAPTPYSSGGIGDGNESVAVAWAHGNGWIGAPEDLIYHPSAKLTQRELSAAIARDAGDDE